MVGIAVERDALAELSLTAVDARLVETAAADGVAGDKRGAEDEETSEYLQGQTTQRAAMTQAEEEELGRSSGGTGEELRRNWGGTEEELRSNRGGTREELGRNSGGTWEELRRNPGGTTEELRIN